MHKLDHNAYNNLSLIVHETVVESLRKTPNTDREVVFIPISEYYEDLAIDEWLEDDVTIV